MSDKLTLTIHACICNYFWVLILAVVMRVQYILGALSERNTAAHMAAEALLVFIGRGVNSKNAESGHRQQRPVLAEHQLHQIRP
jgi:hypothetical protein